MILALTLLGISTKHLPHGNSEILGVILQNTREHLVIAFVSKRRILYSKCIHSLQSEAFIIFKNIAVPCGNKLGEIWRKKTICNYRSTSVYVSEIRAISAIIHTPRNTHTHTYIHDTPPWKAHSTHIGNLWRKKIIELFLWIKNKLSVIYNN